MKKGLEMLMRAAALFMYADDHYMYSQEKVRRQNEIHRKMKEKRLKEYAQKTYKFVPLRTFTIKGFTIEAYSKKDAIKRLKHRGLI